MLQRLARLRVPLGFACAAVTLLLADPTSASLLTGAGVALIGEALRVWAAGHIEKGREVTRSGPYRLMRHPLYVGSVIMSVGFMLAARSVVVAVIVATYMAATVFAAVRTEEATLDQRFAGEYTAYRRGTASPVDRPFGLARVRTNREHRAVIGLAAGLALLYLRMWW
jgi:protein-S-isoprenylcysteine O-methyltransferase Ste14